MLPILLMYSYYITSLLTELQVFENGRLRKIEQSRKWRRKDTYSSSSTVRVVKSRRL
jgi:hypothetical protein